MKSVSLSIKHAIRRTPARLAHQVDQARRNGQQLAKEVTAAAKKCARTFVASLVRPTAVTVAPGTPVKTRVKFAEQLVTNHAHEARKASEPKARAIEDEVQELIAELDAEIQDENLKSFLDELLGDQDPNALNTSAPPSDPEATDKAFAEMLAGLEVESAEHSMTSTPKISIPVDNPKAISAPPVGTHEGSVDAAFAEVDLLIDQLEARRLAQPTFPMTRQQEARKALDDTTAELTALMDGLKRDISASRGQGDASASEMRPAEKVSFSAQSVSAQAVTEELDGEPIKQIPMRRPHPLLMAEAATVKLAD